LTVDEAMNSGVTFARRVFLFAGVIGLLTLVPQYFMEGRVGRDFPPAITHPEYFYGFVGVGLVWQILFLIISTDPQRLRPAMIAAVLEKLSFGVPVIVLYLQGRLPAMILGFGLFDLFLGVLFVISYRVTAGAIMNERRV
jgi:hypothetical protein